MPSSDEGEQPVQPVQPVSVAKAVRTVRTARTDKVDNVDKAAATKRVDKAKWWVQGAAVARDSGRVFMGRWRLYNGVRRG